MEIHVNLTPKQNAPVTSGQKQMSPKAFIFVSVFAVMLLTFVTTIVISSTKKQVYAHDHFKEVQAQVIESHVSSHYHGNQGSYRRNRSSTITISNSSRDTTYSADITYRYSVNGQSYTSSRYWYAGSGSGYQSDAQNTVNRYPAGAQVTAYYNPDKPEDAVLDNSAPSTTIPYAALGFMWLVILLLIGKGFSAVLNSNRM
jgi:hypothetical protein